MGAVPRRGERIRSHIVNGFLTFLHPRDIFRERHGLFRSIGKRRGKTADFRDPIPVRHVFAHAFLEDCAEFLPERGEFLFLILGEILDQAQHFFHAAFANRPDIATLLQNFAGDIERQVVGIDDPAHEAQVIWHQLLGVVHDEDAAHIQADAVPVAAIPDIERRLLRQVQQLRIFVASFDFAVRPGQRGSAAVRYVLEEFGVLLVGDLRFRACP